MDPTHNFPHKRGKLLMQQGHRPALSQAAKDGNGTLFFMHGNGLSWPSWGIADSGHRDYAPAGKMRERAILEET